MERPWRAEHAVDVETARALIEERFPDLAPARLRAIGEGWDNVALLVNETWLFRFPRRAIAVPLIEAEIAALPALAPRLPLAVPVPERVGRGDARFPHPFAGYRRLPGRTADRAGLDAAARAAAAAPLGAFLRALHATPPGVAPLVPDTLGRLARPGRLERTRERLAAAADAGLLPDAAPWIEAAEDAARAREARAEAVVHGDLDARHVLVDDAGRPVGVIDWGDVHFGDPALDLALAHGFLPPDARAAFRAAYGPIDDETWRLARFRALHQAAALLVYAADVGDEALVREARTALDYALPRARET